jgi:signal transduction histidine kinase
LQVGGKERIGWSAALDLLHQRRARIIASEDADIIYFAAIDGIRVSIADTGSGIDQANLNRIFEPMFTTKARGMGMGLSICKSIIESHNGRIWLTAGSSRGSVFQFELPTGGAEH